MSTAFACPLRAVPEPAPHAASRSRKALRFLTAGSVDDGKSTLIGRLLFDGRAVLTDQLARLEQKAAGGEIDLSLLTDGLEAEREQGITIDVAFRYFATPRRKFIIADAPGHEQYTRNMVTAAAGSDAAVVLVDVTKLELGAQALRLLPQTRRHALLARLLGVPSLVFAVNKLDAVDRPEQVYSAVARAVEAFAREAGIQPAGIVPVSALRGDNVITISEGSWYRGPSLLGLLETLPTAGEAEASDHLALPVQFVSRSESSGPAATNPERVFWGRLAGGRVDIGDEVQHFPSGQRARVTALRRAGRDVQQAGVAESAGLVLDRHLDVSRGDWFFTPGRARPAQRLRANLAWLDDEAARIGRRLWVRHAHRWVHARIVEIHHRLDIASLQPSAAAELAVNDIGSVTVELQQALPLQPFRECRVGGALIVVDPATHRTSGTLLVEEAL